MLMAAEIVPIGQPKPKPPPTLFELVLRIQELAKDSDNIGFLHPHLQMRMKQRGITMRLVLETLRKGEGVSGPKKDQYGDWRIKMRRYVAGRRLQVVVAVREKEFTVVTVI
jgi:hypothetical protein